MAGRPLDQNEIDGGVKKKKKAGTGWIGGQSNARKRRQNDINKNGAVVRARISYFSRIVEA